MKRKDRETEKILEQAFKGNVYQLDMDSIKDKYHKGLKMNNVKNYYLKWKKIAYSMMALSIVLFVGVIIVSVNIKHRHSGIDSIAMEKVKQDAVSKNMVLEQDFFMQCKQDLVELYVFRAYNDDYTKYNYYYIVQEDYQTNSTLIINGEEIPIQNNSYGILAENFVENQENEITFFFKKDGKITQFSIKK